MTWLAGRCRSPGSPGTRGAPQRGRSADRMSWLIWAAAPLVAFAAGRASPVIWALGAGPLLVFAATFTRAAAGWRVTWLDLGCAVVSSTALGCWLATGSPGPATALAIAADLGAAIPTAWKSWRSPA